MAANVGLIKIDVMAEQKQSASRERLDQIKRGGQRHQNLRIICVVLALFGFIVFYPATLTAAAWKSSGGYLGASTMAVVFILCYVYVRLSGPRRYISRALMTCLGLMAGYVMWYDIGMQFIF